MTTYYSKSRKGYVPIENMNDQHVRNAFILQCKELEKIKDFEGSVEDREDTIRFLKEID